MARPGVPESLKVVVVGAAEAALAGGLGEAAGDRGWAVAEASESRELLALLFAGAGVPDAAVLLVDDGPGLSEEHRRQCQLLQLFGLRRFAVSRSEIDRQTSEFLSRTGFAPASIAPLAKDLETAVLKALEGLQTAPPGDDLPLRLALNEVCEDGVIAGRIASGTIAIGDTILFSPSNQTAVVKSVEDRTGADIVLTLEEPVALEPGELASHQGDAPVESDVFKARLCWLGGAALASGQRYMLKLNTTEAPVAVQSIEPVAGDDALADVVLRADSMLALDQFADLPNTGRFTLLEDGETVGAGVISMEGYADQRELITKRATNVQRVAHEITEAAREQRNGHKGGVFWLTGLSGAGKSTVAVETEQRLFDLGYQVYVLDGDNVRHGLNADLGFSPEERAENIRRIGEVAALMARAGMLVLTAFISPYRSDRDRAREAAGEHFREVYISAGLDVCEGRDPKGLYEKARAGKIADFTGISAPYEAPGNPELTVDTGNLSIEQSVDVIADYIAEHFAIT